MWQCADSYQQQAYENFVDYLHRVRKPPTPAMQRGIDFEALACAGKVPGISELILGGQFQYYGQKDYVINGEEFRLVGYLDCLKAGVISDIKRNTKYEYGKYKDSYQHWCYFALVPEAYKFQYLVGAGYSSAPYDEKVSIHTNEEYTNDGSADERIITAVKQFITWLKSHELYDIYVKNFTVKEDI